MSRSACVRVILAAAVLSLGVAGWGVAGCGRSELDSIGNTGAAGHGAGGGSGGTSGGLPELPPTPGFLLCGSALCTTSSQQCCLGVGASGQLATACQSPSSACEGASLQCDEPADCRAAEVCCFGLLQEAGSSGGGAASSVTLGSRCGARASCAGIGRLILCRKDSDCGTAGVVCCPGLGVPTCQSSCPSL